MANNIGKITQIIGAVLYIKFTEGNLPEINDAIKVPTRDGKELVVEVSQHLGDDIVRCIAMGSTDGLVRGMDAIATGAPISVPVGRIRLDVCSMFWEILLTRSIHQRVSRHGLFIEKHLPLKSRQLLRKC